jgi:hypothetical protein
MKLKYNTTSVNCTFAELETSDWFSKVGGSCIPGTKTVSSWGDAVQSLNDPEWSNLCLSARNGYVQALKDTNHKMYKQWNVIAIEVKKLSDPLVASKVAKLTLTKQQKHRVAQVVAWDIMHCLMEAAYSDIVKPGFYSALSYYYVQGRLPCGWFGGEYPDGMQLIY